MSDKMSCGHEYRYISRSDERTNFCVWCEWQATVAELAQLRAALAQAQAERDAALEDARAARSQIEIERNAQRAIWNELRVLFDCKPNESLVAVCNKTISDLNILGAENTELQNALDDAVARRDAASERADRAETALQRVRAELGAATRRAEQAEAVLSEQADIITANLWHIPPEYAARNILLDVAMKMRAALAGPEGGPR